MSLHSNTDLLSGAAKFRRQPREKGKKSVSIVFDDKARAEYLTGFKKRNKEKKKQKIQRVKEQLQKDKAEKRRDKRKRIREALNEFVKTDPSFQEYKEELENKAEAVLSKVKYEEEGTTTTVVIETLEQ